MEGVTPTAKQTKQSRSYTLKDGYKTFINNINNIFQQINLILSSNNLPIKLVESICLSVDAKLDC